MISLLRGLVASLSGNLLTLDVQGVGYEVICTQGRLSTLDLGQEVQIVIFTEVKEESIRLYGFADSLEKQVFLLLTKVKGVGARTACDIVSYMDKRELLKAIGEGNLTRLQGIRGIGKKTAERIIVELKDKVGEYVIEQRSSGLRPEREITHNPGDEAIEALIVLGFARKDAERVVHAVQADASVSAKDAGVLVKEALRHI